MKKLLVSLLAAGALVLTAPRAEAKVVAVYAGGHGGLQNSGASDPGFGLTLGARVLVFDGYVDYTAFTQRESLSRGILGLRGGFGTSSFRLVLRGGAGTIHEEGGALTGPLGAPSRTGAVARLGAAVEGALNPFLYLGFGFDGETYKFPTNTVGIPTQGSDIFASMRLTFELGI